jgi:glutathione synthase/RimK-type ligase-like ATP-grasp enzyme
MEENQDRKNHTIPFLCNFIDYINPIQDRQNADFGTFLKSMNLNFAVTNSVLILSNSNDIDSTILGIFLAKNGINYTRINQEDFHKNLTIRLKLCDKETSYKISLSGSELLLDNIDLVLRRDLSIGDHNFSTNNFHQKYTVQQWNSFLNSMFQKLSCPWINTLDSTNRSDDRFTVLQFAKQTGFKIPDTMISNDGGELRRFYHEHNGQVISKVLNHHNIVSNGNRYSIFSHYVTKEDLSLLTDLEPSPFMFQEMIHHTREVRITTVGSELFATELDLTDKKMPVYDIHRIGVDNIRKYAISIPDDYKEKCIHLIDSLGLSYGTIDLVQGIDDEYYFLEVNSVGDWYWIEKCTQQPITQAIVDMIKKIIRR